MESISVFLSSPLQSVPFNKEVSHCEQESTEGLCRSFPPSGYNFAVRLMPQLYDPPLPWNGERHLALLCGVSATRFWLIHSLWGRRHDSVIYLLHDHTSNPVCNGFLDIPSLEFCSGMWAGPSPILSILCLYFFFLLILSED